MLDVLEIYRQNLWNGVNPIPSLTDYISHKEKWWSLPVKFLQILRYFLITISRHIPNDTDKKTEEEIALNQSNVLNLGNLIFAKYIKHSLNTLQTQCQQWNDTGMCMNIMFTYKTQLV
ncbi:hypothetical protein FSP39_009571 [Pinctada imbricata]|uniref:Uncharacterized protein n=1 Tax=Pinctada imbricata TaxID=66713 RepID=A0AA89BX65_PINIB|nr:hypothetical protein FSP39_009571 [Pinctada imbricata]